MEMPHYIERCPVITKGFFQNVEKKIMAKWRVKINSKKAVVSQWY